MALADDIRTLRDRTLAELAAAHDYYVHTQFAWRLVRRSVSAGRAFTVRNRVTGSAVSQDQLAALSHDYAQTLIAQATFSQFIATFEAFVFDLLRLWLTAHPQSLFAKQVEFRAVWEAPDKDAVVAFVVGRELNELLYQRPSAWFEYLESRVRATGPTPEDVARVTEAKATRDVIAHNRSVANKVYVQKAGPLARRTEGDYLPLPEAYHRGVFDLLSRCAAASADGMLVRAA